MAKYDSYVICTSPRSGSTLLCSLLAATGIAGHPASYFHELSIAGWLEDLDMAQDDTATDSEALASIFRTVIARGSRGTGLFGLRLQRHSFDFFTRQLAVLHPAKARDAARLHAAFGRTLYVHLTRGDKIAQAVSYMKAEQSGLWHMAPDGSELERLSPPREPVYDSDALQACFRMMTAYDREWADWFESEGIHPLRISYEALAAEPAEILSQLLDQLGLDPKVAAQVAPGVRKLADASSRDWTARLRSELGIA